MKRSIRLKVALAAGMLSSILVVMFAILSAAWFYKEHFEGEGPNGTVHIPSAEEIADARDDIRGLTTAYILVLPFVAAVAAVGTWWMAGRLTDPLTNLAEVADRIDARTLHERLPMPNGNDEISRLTGVLNGLFERLEASFAQASRFSADASHELRTPLAIMRGEIEVAIQAAPAGPQAAMLVGLLEENQRLSAITDRLLLLARADSGRLLEQRQTLNLSELTSEAAEDFQILADERTISMEWEVIPDAHVSGDETLLRQVLLNLFDNALKYNRPGGWVRAQLERTAGEVRFYIANSGPTIPLEARERLFERFFRSDFSRQRGSGGAGLGLSICSEIVSAHGGELRLIDSTEDETSFLMSLSAVEPLAQAWSLGKGSTAEENAVPMPDAS